MFIAHKIDHTIKKTKGQLANLLTLANLGMGALAIFYAMKGQLHITLLLIFLAAFFDWFDGKIARKLNITSEFGKQLDSLCDLISFGVAPAFLIYQKTLFEFGTPAVVFTILFIMCGAIRLARFNVIEFSGSFVGLPITAAGVFITFSALFTNHLPHYFYMFFIIILSFLMISTISIKKY
ncbi:CDP-diacylglycerol--serine O-phosphatidyltransferase [Pseudalkalibacillus caeni]|uniref:CDP-diacylglycerol--serine O-phosphatidyltransferase n=1 Tax=Exobacillus caeni TaxID=2574798 RepID=A0A5R9FAR4_9BACL|nr:CDP-diacylglycerol--serine O-phosphatidyltransferase [Pseudalkalibacillus caeni]TLS39320.1 CDP-diacylglycerol--serine O-phosphatidyltransferase [Pseudalkalibacillus caeni]